jgi:hypothetical protein
MLAVESFLLLITSGKLFNFFVLARIFHWGPKIRGYLGVTTLNIFSKQLGPQKALNVAVVSMLSKLCWAAATVPKCYLDKDLYYLFTFMA